MLIVKHENGFALLMTLIVLLVMSMMFIAQEERFMMSATILSDQNRKESLSMQLQMRLHAMELQYPSVPNGMKILSENACQQIVLLTVFEKEGSIKGALQSADIFVRVPVPTNCPSKPLFQRLWWRENPAIRSMYVNAS